MSKTKKILFAVLLLLFIMIIATRSATGTMVSLVRFGVVIGLLLFLYHLIFITKVRQPLDTNDHLVDKD